MPPPLDTSIDAYRRQSDAYRAMKPAERLRLAAEMSADVRALTASGIRRRHPDWSPDAREAELTRILIGPQTSAQAGTGDPTIDR
jgi:hypothetical protein